VPGVRRPHRDTNKTIDFRTRILYVRDKGNWLTKCCVVIRRKGAAIRLPTLARHVLGRGVSGQLK
jgi:hypothetical protein